MHLMALQPLALFFVAVHAMPTGSPSWTFICTHSAPDPCAGLHSAKLSMKSSVYGPPPSKVPSPAPDSQQKLPLKWGSFLSISNLEENDEMNEGDPDQAMVRLYEEFYQSSPPIVLRPYVPPTRPAAQRRTTENAFGHDCLFGISSEDLITVYRKPCRITSDTGRSGWRALTCTFLGVQLGSRIAELGLRAANWSVRMSAWADWIFI